MTPQFIVRRPWGYYLEEGLLDINRNEPISISYSIVNGEEVLKVTKIAEKLDNTFISFVFCASIPENAGKTKSF